MEKLLLEILNELKSLRSDSAELWNVDDIAHYVRLSRSSVQSRIICRKDFPFYFFDSHPALRLPASKEDPFQLVGSILRRGPAERASGEEAQVWKVP